MQSAAPAFRFTQTPAAPCVPAAVSVVPLFVAAAEESQPMLASQDMPDFLRGELIIGTDQRLNLVKVIANIYML